MMKRWTEEETEVLKQNMDNTLVNLKQLLPERTEDQILEKIKVLYRGVAFDRWDDDELKIVKDNSEISIFELIKLIPTRTFSAIHAKRTEIRGIMGIGRRPSPWTREQISQLETLKKDKYTNYEIAVALGKPLNSVLGKLYSTGNVIRKNRHIWTEYEVSTLRERVASEVPVEDIAKELGLTSSQVFNKALHSGYISTNIKTQASVNRELNNKVCLPQAIKEARVLKKLVIRKDKKIDKLIKKIEKMEAKLK
jgi:hypothetical protein